MAKSEKSVEFVADASGKYSPPDKWQAFRNAGGFKAGWKTCPTCKGGVSGPNTNKCGGCGAAIEVKPRGSGKAKNTTASASVPAVASVADDYEKLQAACTLFLLKQGGIDKGKKALASIADDPAIVFAVRCGSVEKALSIIDDVEELLSP